MWNSGAWHRWVKCNLGAPNSQMWESSRSSCRSHTLGSIHSPCSYLGDDDCRWCMKMIIIMEVMTLEKVRVYSAKCRLWKRVSAIDAPAVLAFYQCELQFYELHINIENTVWGSPSGCMLKFVMSFYGCLSSCAVQGFIKLQKSPLGDKIWYFQPRPGFVNVHQQLSCLHWSLQSAAVNCQFTTALL